jgi:hypothetical protein
MARCQVEAGSGGKVKLLLNSTAGLSIWLDGVPVETRERLDLDLRPGVHTLTLAVDLAKRGVGLRCELDDAAGSPPPAGGVGGK